MEKLILKAKEVSKNAYIPYSNFPVGASIKTKDGNYYVGCNIENASYGLTNCAERTCLFGAYAHGVKKEDIVMMCIYSPKNHVVSPCGACRQVMAEFLKPNTIVTMFNLNKEYLQMTINELLPYSFDKGDLDDK